MIAVLAGCKPKEHNSYEFAKGSTLPIVEFNINGIWAGFLVDTGAEHNMLSTKFVEKHLDSFKITDTLHLASITANGVETIETYHTKGIINDTLSVVFMVNSLNNATTEMSHSSGKNVVGILGYDFIKDNKVVFDFDKKELPKFKTE